MTEGGWFLQKLIGQDLLERERDSLVIPDAEAVLLCGKLCLLLRTVGLAQAENEARVFTLSPSNVPPVRALVT